MSFYVSYIREVVSLYSLLTDIDPTKLLISLEVKTIMATNFVIEGLKATIDNKEILKGINLSMKGGEIHAIMGPNGTGKSTLASALMGPSTIYKHTNRCHNNLLSFNRIQLFYIPISIHSNSIS